jgi:hypothetical protein
LCRIGIYGRFWRYGLFDVQIVLGCLA